MEKLESAFKAFDVDGSGKIGIHELKMMIEHDEKLASDDEWWEVIREADQN
jgi:Ca2+-binding EF-hand superfamily protein